MIVLLVLLITFALGYGAYRIIRNGFRYPQSKKLNIFGVFGYFVLIVLGVWLASTVFNRFF
jgi:prolipoprotein diacylglyceryltransferase